MANATSVEQPNTVGLLLTGGDGYDNNAGLLITGSDGYDNTAGLIHEPILIFTTTLSV